MIYWLILLFSSTILSIGSNHLNVNKIKIFTFNKWKYNFNHIFTFLILFIFRAFRNLSVGGDLVRYDALFEYLGKQTWEELNYPGYEVGWIYFNKISYIIYPNFQIVLILVALFFTFSLLKYIFTYSDYPWLSLFLYISLYFLGATFNNERQAISLAFLFISFKYMFDKNIFKFSIFLIIASLFHLSSIIFIIIYFLNYIKINYKYWFVIFVISILTFIFRSNLLEFFLRFFYTEKYQGLSGFENDGFFYLTFLLVILISSTILLRFRKTNTIRNKVFIHMLVISLFIQIFSLEIGFIYRATRIFSISMIFLIPEFIKILKDKKSKILYVSSVLILFSLFYIFSLSNDSIDLIPYSFFWEDL